MPEWTEDMITAADVYEHGELIRSGRPANPGRTVSSIMIFDAERVAALPA
ncbi:MAG: hypothetical protein H7839_00890 [Magnetococcus sp. YQC-5]